MLPLPASGDLAMARSMLDVLPYSVQAYAVLAGVAHGRIWVDQIARPRVMLIWDGRHNIYLACRPDETRRSLGIALYDDLERTLSQQVLALGALAGQWGYALQHGPGHLSEPIVRSLLHGRESLLDLRRVYHLQASAMDVPIAGEAVGDAELDAGCAIEPVDETFLANSERPNHEQVVNWIAENWRGVKAFLEYGFGFALTRGHDVLSWCMAEYVSAGPDGGLRAGIGIETVPAARNHGYATRLARRFVAECHVRETIPHWDCWNDNRPSIAFAEKAGFVLDRTYPIRFGWHNALDRAVVHLRIALGRDDRWAARGWLGRVIERQAGPAAETSRLWPNPELREQLEDHPDLKDLLQDADAESRAAREKQREP